MSKYQNMKIEINEQQPLDEVVKELERLGYICFSRDKQLNRYAFTNGYGWYDLSRYSKDLCVHKTLTQLKAMEN